MISALKMTLAACVIGACAWPAVAQQAPSPGAQEQIALSDQLIAIGIERKDPILVIAGAHLRDNLTNDPIVPLATLPDKDALLEQAKAFAAGREDLVEMIDDIKAANSRGCYNWNGGTGSFSCPIGSQFAR